MALTDRPADWHFVVPLPEAQDTTTRLTQTWTVELVEPVSCGAQEFPFTKPLKVTAVTRRTAEGAELELQLDGEVSTECRVCCAPLTVAIQEHFMYSYILQSDLAGNGQAEEEFCDSDKVTIPVGWLGANIDISPLVWECLVVALPLYAACPDGCASDSLPQAPEESVDPRFLALAELLEQEKQKGGK